MFYKWCPVCHNWHFVSDVYLDGSHWDYYCPKCGSCWDDNDYYWNYEQKEYESY